MRIASRPGKLELSSTSGIPPANEMTCAIPAGQLAGLVETISKNATADTAVARYAAQDAKRFER